MQHLLLLVAVVVIAGAIFDAIGGALERASRDRQHGRFVAEARQEHAITATSSSFPANQPFPKGALRLLCGHFGQFYRS